jgi:hypothetical protein
MNQAFTGAAWLKHFVVSARNHWLKQNIVGEFFVERKDLGKLLVVRIESTLVNIVSLKETVDLS